MPKTIHVHLSVRAAYLLPLLLLATTYFVGCGEKAGQDAGASPATQDAPPDPADVVSDTWDSYYMQGSKVGYVHTMVFKVDRHGQPCLKTKQTTLMDVLRSGEKLKMNFAFSTVENASGQMLEFDYDMPLGSAVRRGFGNVHNKKLLCQTTTDKDRVEHEAEWKEGWRGFFGVEQSLQAKPMKPGEERTFQMLLPPLDMSGQVGASKMKARDYEATQLLGGEFRLLRIDHSLQFSDGETIESVLWSNRDGELLKSQTAGAVQVYRTTKEIALAEDSGPKLDLGTGVIVKLDPTLTRGHGSRRVVYELTLKDGDPAKHFSLGGTQQVKRIGKHTARVTVTSLRPKSMKPPSAEESQPTDDDRKPNSLIQSDDPQIIKLAASVAEKESQPWPIAVSLEKLVHQTITAKNYSQAFASASEALEMRQGDCTEHSVLLAALCRARKIPARVATGLVFSHSAGGFAYHMWNEVWIDDRWIPLDATLGQGGIGAAHLKLSHSSLKAGSAYSVFLPVMNVVGQLEIKVIEEE